VPSEGQREQADDAAHEEHEEDDLRDRRRNVFLLVGLVFPLLVRRRPDLRQVDPIE
jgi:hypothetical protein